MTAVVFVGPTLRREDLASAGDFTWLPPVAQGDIYRAALRRPLAIGVIDGYFSQAPAVWHKEILWAMAQGIHVFGSASMGALRAAELHRLGMRGVGRIFADFRDGVFEDDDEVAVEHGPAELNFVAVSEPMVNIRATLARAEAEGVIGKDVRSELECFAKSLFFPRRNWPALLEAGRQRGLPNAELAAFADWLARGYVDRKREDALEMLAAMREALTRPQACMVDFRFERTYLWEEFVARNAAAEASARGSPVEQDVLDEFRLQGPDACRKTTQLALARLAAAHAGQAAATGASRDLREVLTDMRKGRGLYTKAALDGWLAANHLDEAALTKLLRGEQALEELRARFAPLIEQAVLDELRLGGAYVQLAVRAAQKRAALAAVDPANPSRRAPAPRDAELRDWYFAQGPGGTMPDSVEQFARELGFADARAFDLALSREWRFQKASGVRWNT